MYVLALDESGTHGTSPCTLVAGLAVHELDVRPLEQTLLRVLSTHLGPVNLDPHIHELHAGDLQTPARGKPRTSKYPATAPSLWLGVPWATRKAILEDTYAAISGYTTVDMAFPVAVFGAVVDRRHKTFKTADEKAYDHVLHRFDEMLRRTNKATDTEQRGIVLHDRRLKQEKAIQQMGALWQRTGARLDALAQVPLFADSKASRLVQGADFVSYALWRYYSASPADDSLSRSIWPLVDLGATGEMSGVIHVTPDFGRCPCPPCQSRSAPKPSG